MQGCLPAGSPQHQPTLPCVCLEAAVWKPTCCSAWPAGVVRLAAELLVAFDAACADFNEQLDELEYQMKQDPEADASEFSLLAGMPRSALANRQQHLTGLGIWSSSLVAVGSQYACASEVTVAAGAVDGARPCCDAGCLGPYWLSATRVLQQTAGLTYALSTKVSSAWASLSLGIKTCLRPVLGLLCL